MKLRKVIAWLLVLVLVAGTLPAASAVHFVSDDDPKDVSEQFKDVPNDAWFTKFVEYVYSRNPKLMDGMKPDLFAPQGTLTRAMVAVVLMRSEEPDLYGQPQKSTFTDLKKDWYQQGIAWAEHNDVINGIEPGKFYPETPATREQVVTMMWRLVGSPKADPKADPNLLDKFPDAALIHNYAKEAMLWAVDMELIGGNQGKLNPRDNMTRAEFAKVISLFDIIYNLVLTQKSSVNSTTRTGVRIPVSAIFNPTVLDHSTNETPIILMLHGHGGNRNEGGGYDTIAKTLAKNGMLVVQLDFPGCGESTESFQANTMTNMKQDVLDVINNLQNDDPAHPHPIGVMGYSMGGRIVLEMMAEDMYDFDAVSFVAPAESTEDLKNLFDGAEAWDELKAEANDKGFATYTTIYGQEQELSKEWFQDLEKYPTGLAEAAYANYSGSYPLTIWATNDEAVNPAVSAHVADIFDSVVINTYADGHGYSFYGKDPYTVSTVNRSVAGYFTTVLMDEDKYDDPDALYTLGKSIEKYGNVTMCNTYLEMLDSYEMDVGDMINVSLGGKSVVMPLCTDYSDVDNGEMVCRATSEDVKLAINMGNLAEKLGIAKKAVNQKTSEVEWYYSPDVQLPLVIKMSLNEKGGYLDEWQNHQLTRSNKRDDYPDLTDAEFANFRPITTGDILEGKLYRSSSPINPELGRNTYADKAAQAAGIDFFINLADTEETAKKYSGYADTYYSTKGHAFLNLGVDVQDPTFRTGIADGLTQMLLESNGPYLIHCTEGKDRAGFVCAILECLTNATYDEVIADYMTTYKNYYGISQTEDPAKYETIAKSNIIKTLETTFAVDDLSTANLQEGAKAYLQSCGMDADAIDLLIEVLTYK